MIKINKILKIIFGMFCYLFANLIPKNKNLWVYGAWFGKRYSDNPKAFFEFVSSKDENINSVWISKQKDVVTEVINLGYTAYYYLSFKGIICQLRAKYIFICTSKHDDLFAPAIGNKSIIVQLWHGIPLKKIMYDAFSTVVEKRNLLGKLENFLTPYNEDRNDYLIATSDLTQKILSNAFNLNKSKTLVTGFPRNDVFFDNQITKNKNYKCIYMPTHRGGNGADFDLFESFKFDFDTIENIFKENNIKLVLRMHPFNKPSKLIIDKIKDSKYISIDYTSDIYSSICDYDCLITDYSSIYFDFLLSGKPIIFAPFDLEEYKQRERALYFELDDVTLKPYCYNWNEVALRIIELKNNKLSSEYIGDYNKLTARFHGSYLKSKSPFSTALYNNIVNNKDN